MTTAYHASIMERKSYAAQERRLSTLPLSLRAGDDFLLSLHESEELSAIAEPPSLKLAVPNVPSGRADTPQAGALRGASSDAGSSFSDDEDDRLIRTWTLSPMSSLRSASLAEIPFVSPQSTATTTFKRSAPGSALAEIRVELGLLHMLPRELCLRRHRMPCAVFTFNDLETGQSRWHFVKEYEQLANFNELVQHLLAPLVRQTGFRLREFPSRDLFATKIPWKVDLRNDMLNAYFKSLFWLYDMDQFRRDQELRDTLERAVQALWLGDKVDAVPLQPFGLCEEMCGFLLTRSRTARSVDWSCHYYALNGCYLDVIDDLATGHVRESICLYGARIEKLIVLYLAKADNERYAINIYEPLPRGKQRLHTLCAENEPMRQRWLYHLRERVANLTPEDKARKARSRRIGAPGAPPPPLPYALHASARKSPYFSNEMWSGGVRRNAARIVAALAHEVPDAALAPQLFSRCSASSDSEPAAPSPATSPSKISVSVISGPVATLNISRDAVLADAIATETQDMLHGRAGASGAGSPGKPRRGAAAGAAAAPVFGVMPSACQHQLRLSREEHVPSVVARCLEVLRAHTASEEVGLFRISGTQKRLDELEALFDQHGDYDMVRGMVDVHTTADLLKRYLRGLPDRLFAEYPEARVQQVLALPVDAQIELLKSDLCGADPVNYAVVRAVVQLLHGVSANESKNAMGLRNLGVAMSPSLRVPVPILQVYIERCRAIF